METVYIVAIIAAAVVILVVAILYRERLTRARLSISRDKVDADLQARPGQAGEGTAGARRPTRQRGKTVVDDDLLIKSRISAPRDTDLKVRESKLFGSEIEIRDAAAGEDQADD